MWGLRGTARTPWDAGVPEVVFQIQWMRETGFFFYPPTTSNLCLACRACVSELEGWIWRKLTAPPNSILKAMFNFDSCAQMFWVIFFSKASETKKPGSLLETSMTCLRGSGDLGEDSHREEGDRKSEKEGRDVAWGPKQETDDIYICRRRSRVEWGRKIIRIRMEEVKYSHRKLVVVAFSIQETKRRPNEYTKCGFLSCTPWGEVEGSGRGMEASKHLETAQWFSRGALRPVAKSLLRKEPHCWSTTGCPAS